MHKFRIPIGDWSDDGHGECEYYTIESSRPVEEIRELYFQACEKAGFGLDGGNSKTRDINPCVDYGERTIDMETIEKLREFGLIITAEEAEYWSNDGIDTEDFCDLLLAFIRTQDKDLNIARVPNKDLPMLPFYRYDENNRHIGYFGYGLFEG